MAAVVVVVVAVVVVVVMVVVVVVVAVGGRCVVVGYGGPTTMGSPHTCAVMQPWTVQYTCAERSRGWGRG